MIYFTTIAKNNSINNEKTFFDYIFSILCFNSDKKSSYNSFLIRIRKILNIENYFELFYKEILREKRKE